MDLRELQAAYLKELRQVTKEKLKRGALIRTVVSKEEGLVLVGRTEKPKLMVIVGYDQTSEIYYGSVLVNSKMNPRAAYSVDYLAAQYMLKREDYPEFLSHDSFADCGVLFAIPTEKLLKGEYYGELNVEDQKGIIQILTTTDTLTDKIKRRFGLI